MFGLTCHTPSTYGPLKFTVVGIQRRLSRPMKKMQPITGEMFYNLLVYPLLTDIVSDETVDLMITIRAFYIVAFFSMLRASNLVPISENKVDPLMQLTWGAVRGFDDGVVITVKNQKRFNTRSRLTRWPWPEWTTLSFVLSLPWSVS